MKKNLLVITPCYPDGEGLVIGDPFVKSQVESISKYFDKVYIISSRPFGFGFLSKLFDVKPTLRNYSYNNIKVFYPTFFHLPTTYYRNKLGDNQLQVVNKCIKKNNLNFDVIHAHFIWPCGYIGVKLKEIYNKKLIVTGHGSDIRDTLKGNNGLAKNKLNYVLKKSDKIHTNHEELYDLLIDNYYIFKDKIVFTYKGINIDIFNKKDTEIIEKGKLLISELGLQNKTIILFLGNLNEFKDPITFLNAANLLKNNNNFVFLIAGGGDLKSGIKKYVKLNNLSNVKILGERNDTNILYSISDIFCALSPYENIWSTTIQEAFCMGLPCIITNAGYTSKILKNKKDCLIIPPKNPQKLMEQILKIHNNIELKNELINRQLVWKNKFDSKILSIENFQKLYMDK